MSSMEKSSNDIMQFVYAGAIGLVTLGIGAYICLRSGNKQNVDDTFKEQNVDINKNENEPEKESEEKKESRRKKKRKIKQKKKMKKKKIMLRKNN